jgi:hypothetical protein
VKSRKNLKPVLAKLRSNELILKVRKPSLWNEGKEVQLGHVAGTTLAIACLKKVPPKYSVDFLQAVLAIWGYKTLSAYDHQPWLAGLAKRVAKSLKPVPQHSPIFLDRVVHVVSQNMGLADADVHHALTTDDWFVRVARP